MKWFENRNPDSFIDSILSCGPEAYSAELLLSRELSLEPKLEDLEFTNNKNIVLVRGIPYHIQYRISDNDYYLDAVVTNSDGSTQVCAITLMRYMIKIYNFRVHVKPAIIEDVTATPQFYKNFHSFFVHTTNSGYELFATRTPKFDDTEFVRLGLVDKSQK